jgi:uncharacterized protein DUF2530
MPYAALVSEPQRQLKPLDPRTVPFAIGGMVIWAVVGIVLLVFRHTLSAHGHSDWLWICLAGFLAGIPGLLTMITHDRHRRERRAAAAAGSASSSADPESSGADPASSDPDPGSSGPDPGSSASDPGSSGADGGSSGADAAERKSIG